MIKENKQEKNIMSFSNLNKIFPDACEIFNKDEKDGYDDEDNKTKVELSISNIQTIFLKVNKEKMPEKLNSFSSGDKLRIQAIFKTRQDKLDT